jgi:hypothetical protein
MQKITLNKNTLASAALLFTMAVPAFAQRGHNKYYNGMHNQVRRGDYGHGGRYDDRYRHDDRGGGIGPGKGALIGAGGGAVLGAIFGGGLKGTIIGGAAGAGIGAIGGKLAQDNRDDHRYYRR